MFSKSVIDRTTAVVNVMPVASNGSTNPALNPTAQTFLTAISLCVPHFISRCLAVASNSPTLSLNSFSASSLLINLLLLIGEQILQGKCTETYITT
jgi:hypothetical protein